MMPIIKNKFIAIGLLILSQFLTLNSSVQDLESLCPKLKQIQEIDEMIICLHQCIQDKIKNTPQIVAEYPSVIDFEIESCKQENTCSRKKQIQDLDKFATILEKSLAVFPENKICLIRENANVFIRSIRLYVMWATILEIEPRDDSINFGYFRFSHYRGYSLAYSTYQQSKAILLLQLQNQRNFLDNNDLIKGIDNKTNNIDKKVSELLKYYDKNKFGFTLSFFSGGKNDASFRYIGLNYQWSIKSTDDKLNIVPELGIEFEGDHTAFSGLSFAYNVSEKIQLFAGGDVVFPKTSNTDIGWHIGLNIISVRPLVVGVKYSNLFDIGIHLTVLL